MNRTHNNTSHRTRKNYGFTIIEVIVVLFVIGILIIIGSVSYNAIQIKAKDVTAKEDLAKFGNMMVKYKAENGSYPSNTNVITGAYAVAFNTDVLSDTSYYNLLYCSASPYGSYALAAVTKSGARIYVKNGDSPAEYTGSVAWTANNASGICGSILSGSTSTGLAGFRISGETPTGWRPWASGN